MALISHGTQLIIVMQIWHHAMRYCLLLRYLGFFIILIFIILISPECGLAVKASQSVALSLILSLHQTKRLKKLVFTASLLDVQH